MTTAGVENASCEFDVETLCPTYKPAHRHPRQVECLCDLEAGWGFPRPSLKKPSAQMDSESIHFEDVLTQLEQKRQQLRERTKPRPTVFTPQREEDARKARDLPRRRWSSAKENARSQRRSRGQAHRLAEAQVRRSDDIVPPSSTRCASQQKKLACPADERPARRDHAQHQAGARRCGRARRERGAHPQALAARFRSAIWSRSPVRAVRPRSQLSRTVR